MAKTQLNILGSPVRATIHSEQTDGAIYQFEIHLPPGNGVPPHVHTAEDEAVYVLEGGPTIIYDGQEMMCKAGDALAFERGTAHGFFNRTDRPVRLLITASPGTEFEAFFQELDALCSQSEPEFPAVAELAGRYGMTFIDG